MKTEQEEDPSLFLLNRKVEESLANFNRTKSKVSRKSKVILAK